MLAKRIKDCPGYFIREDGLVWSTISNKFLKNQILSSNNYFAIKISVGGKSKWKTIHRLLAENFIDNPLNKATVNHIDSNRQNNSLGNLEWNTYGENNKHSWVNSGGERLDKFNKSTRGVLNSSCKLTEKQVLAIRKEYKDTGIFQRELGKKFGISQTTVRRIISRIIWTHI